MGEYPFLCHKNSHKNFINKIYYNSLNNNNAFFDNNIDYDILNINKEKKTHDIKINDINNNKNKIINDLKNLDNEYNSIKLSTRIFYDDIEEKEKYITNYRAFLSELNHQINNLKDHLNIVLFQLKYFEKLIYIEDKNSLINDIEKILNKINEMESLLEIQKLELKNLESNFKVIQEQFNEIKKYEQIFTKDQLCIFIVYIDSIKGKIVQSKNVIKNINENKIFYEKKKIEIENGIYDLQDKTEKKVSSIKKKRKSTLKNLNLNKYYNDNYYDSFIEINDSLFLKGSMLLVLKDFKKAEEMLQSMYIFKKDNENNYFYEKQRLIKQNWYETCYINDDYDIHDINYELKAFGLPDDFFFTSSFFDFSPDSNIEIILFEINDQIVNYELEKYSLRFRILLTNFESYNIHIIYKESPSYNKITENQKEMTNIYRRKFYGISHRLVGQKAKYILVNVSSFEIINFENEFFIKNEMSEYNEYQWGGKVPENGRETLVRMSKKVSHVSFYEKYTIKTLDNSFIKNSSIKINYCYNGGNNTLIKSSYNSMQTEKIILDQNKRIFEIFYIDKNSPRGEFIFKGELINRCKGEWKINLSNEEIDNLVPSDYKINKEPFKYLALDIIKEYDQEHRDDIVIVHDVVKIGKWVNKNIKYDLSYTGLNNITAKETYELRRGVCHHKTKLFNALMYSLGYQVLYILGYAIDKTKSFSINDSHAWSLIKIKGQWLPFDATYGIFSGKLPVTHVFKQIEDKIIESIKCYDKIKFEQIEVYGNFS